MINFSVDVKFYGQRAIFYLISTLRDLLNTFNDAFWFDKMLNRSNKSVITRTVNNGRFFPAIQFFR